MESFSFDSSGMAGLMNRDSVSFRIEIDVELSEAVTKAGIHPKSGVLSNNGQIQNHVLLIDIAVLHFERSPLDAERAEARAQI